MFGSRKPYFVLAAACVWLLAGCNSPSSPDIAAAPGDIPSPTTSLSGGQVGASTTGENLYRRGPDPRPRPVIFVRSQGLYYDSIVTADPLPPKGPFQLLEMGPNGLETEYGPGDRGYVGGRWQEDFDGDGVFHYFSCPLLGPGRTSP